MNLEQMIRKQVRVDLKKEIDGEIADLIADKYINYYLVEDLARYIDHFSVVLYQDSEWKLWYKNVDQLADCVEGFTEDGELTTNPLEFSFDHPFYFLNGCCIHLHIPSDSE